MRKKKSKNTCLDNLSKMPVSRGQVPRLPLSPKSPLSCSWEQDQENAVAQLTTLEPAPLTLLSLEVPASRCGARRSLLCSTCVFSLGALDSLSMCPSRFRAPPLQVSWAGDFSTDGFDLVFF